MVNYYMIVVGIENDSLSFVMNNQIICGIILCAYGICYIIMVSSILNKIKTFLNDIYINIKKQTFFIVYIILIGFIMYKIIKNKEVRASEKFRDQ